MLENNKYILGLIVLLTAVIGYQYYLLNCKRREDIIKLLIRKEKLPIAAPNTTWVQGGACFMEDKTTGRVDGGDCVAISVL